MAQSKLTGKKRIIDYDDEDIIAIVMDDLRASEDDRAIKNEQNFQAWRMFHCRDIMTSDQLRGTKDDVVGGRFQSFNLDSIPFNKAYIPFVRSVVLTSIAKQARGLWPDFNDFYRMDPDDESDVDAAKIAFAMSKYFVRASRYKQEAMLSLVQCHLFDFSILYTGWMSKMKMVPALRPSEIEIKDFETGEYIKTGKLDYDDAQVVLEEHPWDGWDVAALNTMNVRYDPMATHEGFGEFVGLTALTSKRLCSEYVDTQGWSKAAVDSIYEDEPANHGDHEDGTKDFTARLKEDEKLSGQTDDGYIQRRYVRTETMWYPYSGGVCKVVILNGKRVALKEETWRIPLHKQVFIQNPGMFSGTSLVEPLMPIQVDMNQCLRLLRTQQDRAINPDSVVDPTFFASVEEAQIQPWGTGATIYATRNPQGRDPQLARRFIYHPSNTSPDMWNSIEIQKASGEQVSATSQQDQGISGGGATATEIARSAAGSDNRSAFIEVFLEDSMVIQPISDLYLLMQANVREPRAIQIKGEAGMKWKRVKPEEMVMTASPVIVPLGMSSMSSRQIGAQAVRDITLAFLSNPMTAQFLKTVPSMREVYRLADVNPDTFVNDEDLSDNVSIPAEYIGPLLAGGHSVPINPWDDHAKILAALGEYAMSKEFKGVPYVNKKAILKHIELRQAALAMGEGGSLGSGAPSLPNMGGGGGGQMVGQPPGQTTPAAAPGVVAAPRPGNQGPPQEPTQ